MSKKIMVVDDVEISNFIMKKMISNVSTEHQVYDFTSPNEALRQMDTINPDLVFLDLNMPVIDGWSFMEKMKESGNLCPIYILTSSTSELDRERSKAFSNVAGFLIKPIPANELSLVLS
ncbi:MAG: response regulator [Segetibacter sp.]|jgi:two-component system nitrate/nitrite response regulator NarL|nr:response regulator [Segetibacter sp.]